MTQSTFAVRIDVEWWPANADLRNVELDASTKDFLEDAAMHNIHRMVTDGLRRGELKNKCLDPSGKFVEYEGRWKFAKESAEAKWYRLPYDIVIGTTGDGGIALSSDLVNQFTLEGEAPGSEEIASADALESFLLALAGEGVNLGGPKIKCALQTAVGAIAGNLPDDREVEEESIIPKIGSVEALDDFKCHWVIYSPNEAATQDGDGYWSYSKALWRSELEASSFRDEHVNSGYAFPQSLGQDRRWKNVQIGEATDEKELCDLLESFCKFHGLAHQSACDILHENDVLTLAQRIWLNQFIGRWETVTGAFAA